MYLVKLKWFFEQSSLFFSLYLASLFDWLKMKLNWFLSNHLQLLIFYRMFFWSSSDSWQLRINYIPWPAKKLLPKIPTQTCLPKAAKNCPASTANWPKLPKNELQKNIWYIVSQHGLTLLEILSKVTQKLAHRPSVNLTNWNAVNLISAIYTVLSAKCNLNHVKRRIIMINDSYVTFFSQW
jgi:hypothetical protein